MFPHEHRTAPAFPHLPKLPCPSSSAVLKPCSSRLAGDGFCNFGMVTLKLEAAQVLSPYHVSVWLSLVESGYICWEGSLRWGALGKTTARRRLLLRSPLSKCWSRLRAAGGGEVLTGFELLLTAAFCFQSCGLSFMVIPRIFRWNGLFK